MAVETALKSVPVKSIEWKRANQIPSIPRIALSVGLVQSNARRNRSNLMRIDPFGAIRPRPEPTQSKGVDGVTSGVLLSGSSLETT